MGKPRMMFYHDGRHSHIYRYEPPMAPEEYTAMVDELAGTPVDAIMLCLGEGRTMLHDTRAGELWGHNVDKWDPKDIGNLVFQRAHRNARGLIDRGHDPLRILCDRAHDLGMALYATLILQRGGVNHAGTRCSDFRRDNPHLEIGAGGRLGPDHPAADLLDFAHEESREERFAIVDEVMGDYPVDGFELHFNAMPYYFHPDDVEAGRRIMTDWVGRVHETVKRGGVDKELVVRVPDRLEDCVARGLDPEEWVRRGIVDVIVPETIGENYQVKPMADYGEFLSLVKGRSCRVHGTINSEVSSDRLADAPVSMMRAIACNHWAQGVHGLYLSEWFNLWPYEASVYEKLRELPYPEIMAAKDKFYLVPTEGAVPRRPGTPLPRRLKRGEPVDVALRIADDLPRWHAKGRVHEVLLRARVVESTELDRLEFRLNGRPLPDRMLRKISEVYKISGPRYRVMGAYWYVFRLDPDHWPATGENVIRVTLKERDPDVLGDSCVLRDVELEVKYLMGRSFSKGFVDPDLGPYDHSNS